MKKLLLATFLLALAASALAADIKDLVRNCEPAVVHIATFDKQGNSLSFGTGFFVSSDGYLVTNEHVVDGAYSILARDYKGTVFHVFRSKDSLSEFASANGTPDPDLEVLRADATNVPYLKLGPTTNEVEGQRVLVIGNPLNEEFTVSDGIISAFRANRSYVQITAPISAGSSGSPVLDCDSGQVIGIVVMTRKDGQNMNLAIATEKIQETIIKTASISLTSPPIAKATPTPWQPPAEDFVTPWVDPNADIKRTENFTKANKYRNQGLEELSKKDYRSAITDLNEAVRLQPDYAEVYHLLGRAYYGLKNYDESINNFAKALEATPFDNYPKIFFTQVARELKNVRKLKGNR